MKDLAAWILVFLAGLLIGSFLMVVGLQAHTQSTDDYPPCDCCSSGS